jgi:hypothetical protein
MSTTTTTTIKTSNELTNLQKFLKNERVLQLINYKEINKQTNLISRLSKEALQTTFERAKLISEADKNFKSEEFINLCSINGVKFSSKAEFISTVFCNLSETHYYDSVKLGEIPLTFFISYINKIDELKKDNKVVSYDSGLLQSTYNDSLLTPEQLTEREDKKKSDKETRKKTANKMERVKDGVKTEISILNDGTIKGTPQELILFLNDISETLKKVAPEMLLAWIKNNTPKKASVKKATVKK